MQPYLLIEPHFLPSIQYMGLVLQSRKVIFDDIVRFRKQSYLNRAYIRGPEGPRPLIVPVQRGKTRLPVGKVSIDYRHRWVDAMCRTIRYNYSHSPFFLFYYDLVVRPLRARFAQLAMLNVALIQEMMRALRVEWQWSWRSAWDQLPPVDDRRYTIHPKARHHRPDPRFQPPAYYQLFSEDGTFYANLSVIDLLFNEGPEALTYLKAAYADPHRDQS